MRKYIISVVVIDHLKRSFGLPKVGRSLRRRATYLAISKVALAFCASVPIPEFTIDPVARLAFLLPFAQTAIILF
jgi:hypothetical protein